MRLVDCKLMQILRAIFFFFFVMFHLCLQSISKENFLSMLHTIHILCCQSMCENDSMTLLECGERQTGHMITRLETQFFLVAEWANKCLLPFVCRLLPDGRTDDAGFG